MNEGAASEPPLQFDQRVSDRDRDQVANVLRRAAGDGRLSLDELDERLGSCFAAMTYRDLAGLVADLPGQEQPKDVVHAKRIGGNVRYEGPWLVPRRLQIEVRGGSALLDFSNAIVAWPVCEVDVGIDGGSLRLIVPGGCVVDTDDVQIEGGSLVHRHAKGRPADAQAVYRILVTGRVAGGKVVVTAPSTS